MKDRISDGQEVGSLILRVVSAWILACPSHRFPTILFFPHSLNVVPQFLHRVQVSLCSDVQQKFVFPSLIVTLEWSQASLVVSASVSEVFEDKE